MPPRPRRRPHRARLQPHRPPARRPGRGEPPPRRHRPRRRRRLEISGLRWTFICPPRMVDGEETGKYRHGPDTLIIGSMTTRYADVAHLIVRCLEDDLYVGHRVAIVD
ncbi:MAG: NAD(P)H-binding protein [Myxococcales bacterium]|nr:NAD(P)H-binding protein [Myxococcales bacterium]